MNHPFVDGNKTVGSRGFAESVKSILCGLVKGRKVKEAGEGYQLREAAVPYGDQFEVENDDIGLQNAYFQNKYSE